MDDWSNDLTPEPARRPPPKRMDLSNDEIWDGDQSSLPSLPPDETATFSSDPSLGARVISNLQTSVPKHVLSRRPRIVEPVDPSPRRRPSPALLKPMSARSARRNVPREIKLDNQLELLRKELAEANATIEKLQHEPRDDLTRLHKTIEVLSASNTRLAEEAKALQLRVTEETTKCSTALAEAHNEETAARLALQACNDELRAAKEAMAMEKQTVVRYTRTCEQLESQLTERHSEESQALAELRRFNDEMSAKTRDVEERNKELHKQIEESMRALDLKCKECMDLAQERTILRSRLERPLSHDAAVQTDSVETISMGIQTDSDVVETKSIEIQTDLDVVDTRAIEIQTDSNVVETRSIDIQTDSNLVETRSIEIQTDPNVELGDLKSNTISERLTRIREATERTGLQRQHQKEVASLAEEHEQTIRAMEHRYSQRLDENEKQAAEEQTSKLNHVRRSLQAEHQKSLDEMERRHREELCRERSERGRKMSVTTEALEVALSEVAVTTQQLEEESRARAAAEGSLARLSINFEREKKDLVEQHEHTVVALRASCEDDRASMLDDIQAGCNQVFLDSRRLTLPLPTKAVDYMLTREAVEPITGTTKTVSFMPTEEVQESFLSILSPRDPPSTKSPTSQFEFDWSKEDDGDMSQTLTPGSNATTTVSQSLAETEAFVLQVLGGSCL